MPDITIREATRADAVLVAEFNIRLAAESEDMTLDPDTVRAGVTALLDDPSKGRYWLAVAGGEVLGQIMVTWEWSDWRNGMYWWVQSVYVHPAHRRQGIFSALYRHVEQLAMADSAACGIRLYVEHNNHRARDTYAALGMEPSGHVVMQSLFGGHG